MIILTCALVILCLLSLSDTAHTDAPEYIVESDVVNASPAEVWSAFTTNEGQESWHVAHADVDLKIGGRMRTHYDKSGQIGDENTIQNLILSYDPERMLSIRIVDPPKGFPFEETAKSVWTVIYFEPAGEDRTWVTVKMLGWPDTDEARKMREFFVSGNKWVLEKLKEHFAKDS